MASDPAQANLTPAAGQPIVSRPVPAAPPQIEAPASARRSLGAVGRFHVKIAALKHLERDLLLALTRTPDLLSSSEEAIVRWALALGRLCVLRTPEGYDLDLSDDLKPFREWLTTRLQQAITPAGEVRPSALRQLVPTLERRMVATRALLLRRHVNAFGAAHLDAELRHKDLVLVLGGGGGCGFVHLATFTLFEKLGLQPKLIAGASMGALMGLFRAMRQDYDPESAVRVVPRSFDLSNILQPFAGNTRYGFPGIFDLQLLRAASMALHYIEGTSKVPPLSALPIRLEVLVTGVRAGFAFTEGLDRRVARASGGSMTPFALRRRFKFFYAMIQELAGNPRLLRQLVFGREPGTEDFNAVEAVGFSCSVPGVLHYDVFHDDPHTTGVLDTLFERHRLWRLADGGVVNNVPSRVAWESVMLGNLPGARRNAFIFAGDGFAPNMASTNVIYTPIQQIARGNVLSNRPFSDYHKTFRDPPNPVNLGPGYAKLRRIVRKTLDELKPYIPYLRRATSDLPAFDAWHA